MSRPSRKNRDTPLLDDARMDDLFRRAAVAAVLFDPIAAQELLKLPDAELGRRFKICLARVTGMATVLNLDLPEPREQDEKQRSKRKRGAIRRMSSRNALVSAGRLLRAEIFCEALGITDQKLSKRVAKGRVFSVEVGGAQYYPAFFLANGLNRKDLSRVARRLGGIAGWSKWGFFTEPKESLGGLTPLQSLLHGDVKRVLRAAKAAVGHAQNLGKGNVLDTPKS
ncbi:hypothetical protein [Paraburkholderia phenoliruptrix]|uniref:hypothetical protein n=1 Tax=Paraburkholderia phenoliruptrix TaxID=252970 RepID=UPI002869C899|nr:hypothetical protein [Paraburkholderia phenoliruptrix]WMY11082.1 hypothetical protein P3F88_30970 [Paraburkholderia phenoliruptrix]